MIEYISWLWEPIVQGPVVQAWIPLAMAAAGLAMGAYQGKRKEDEARQADLFTGNMAAIDTAYSPYVASQGYKATFTPRGPGALGGAFQGALSGYTTGAGVKQGMMKQDVYSKMLEDMKAKKAAETVQGGFNPSGYSAYSAYSPYMRS